MAVTAKLRGAKVKSDRPGINYGMGAMAIDAGGNIVIAFIHQGLAMDAANVGLVYIQVALGTASRYPQTAALGKGNVMGPVAIGTYRGPGVTCGKELVMDTFQRFGVIGEMASLARLVLGQAV